MMNSKFYLVFFCVYDLQNLANVQDNIESL